jgi:FKBP-type peptidyl-prolyl cis-trans isomerase
MKPGIKWLAMLMFCVAFGAVNAESLMEINEREGKAFLEQNAAKEGVITTASGLQYKMLKEGTGKQPRALDRVTVNYEGRHLNGEVFDSSYQRGKPATFPLNRVIKGWTEGVQLMKEGAKYRLYVPYKLGYGDTGAGRKIGPRETLIFDVELIKVN